MKDPSKSNPMTLSALRGAPLEARETSRCASIPKPNLSCKRNDTMKPSADEGQQSRQLESDKTNLRQGPSRILAFGCSLLRNQGPIWGVFPLV